MKRIAALFLVLFFISKISSAQNRIEVLVNGVVQNVTNEAIRVKNAADIVELRIYFDSTIEKTTLIDKIEVKGCKYTEPGFAEQTNGKKPVITFYKPASKPDYLFIKMKVKKISDCTGYGFSFTPLPGSNSPLNTFKGFRNTYDFYFVL